MPVRWRGVAARVHSAQLLRAGPDPVRHAAPDEVAIVRAAVERYRAAQAMLDAQAEAGRAALIERIHADRG